MSLLIGRGDLNFIIYLLYIIYLKYCKMRRVK